MPHPRTDQFATLIERLCVPAGAKVDLARDHDPAYKAGWARKHDGKRQLELSVEMLAEYQDRLAAEGMRAVLVVLQGIDAAGKDGTIRHVMSGVNPQGVTVHSFKVPSDEELRLSPADVREREYWDDYQHAFSQMLSHTSTEWAPWHVIPADPFEAARHD
jgi:polyphosphate kinase 2 (PPK2 family)